VAELRQLIEASFGRDGKRPRSVGSAGRKNASGEELAGPIRQLELARQRLMERLPRIDAEDAIRRRRSAESLLAPQKAAS
jgi:hypothetical protein